MIFNQGGGVQINTPDTRIKVPMRMPDSLNRKGFFGFFDDIIVGTIQRVRVTKDVHAVKEKGYQANSQVPNFLVPVNPWCHVTFETGRSLICIYLVRKRKRGNLPLSSSMIHFCTYSDGSNTTKMQFFLTPESCSSAAALPTHQKPN